MVVVVDEEEKHNIAKQCKYKPLCSEVSVATGHETSLHNVCHALLTASPRDSGHGNFRTQWLIFALFGDVVFFLFVHNHHHLP
jgi:hypothetical protein